MAAGDIGKGILTSMLEINGYKVIDLGIDVTVANFVESIQEHKPQVVGLSGFLTSAGSVGGYILTGGAQVHNTTAEKLRAMIEAVKEYGVSP
jgi:methylmalonyl-CoA mutase cobalamin-binding subunit